MTIKTRETLSKALASVIQDARIGVPSVIDNQNGPAGVNGQFASIGFPMSLNVGRDEQRFTDDTDGGVDLIETSSGFRELMFSVQIFKEEAVDSAEIARVSLRKHWARQIMLGFGMAFSRISAVRDITATQDAGREQRAQFDVYYNTIQSLTDIVLAIESVDITGTFEGSFHDHTDVINLRKP